jgi:hypothetical protein
VVGLGVYVDQLEGLSTLVVDLDNLGGYFLRLVAGDFL